MRRPTSTTKLLAVLVGTCAVLALSACGSGSSSSRRRRQFDDRDEGCEEDRHQDGRQLPREVHADPYGVAFLNAFAALKKKYGIDVKLVEDVPCNAQMTQITCASQAGVQRCVGHQRGRHAVLQRLSEVSKGVLRRNIAGNRGEPAREHDRPE